MKKRNIHTLLSIQTLIIIIFSIIYYFLGENNFYNMNNSYLDNIYFSLVTSTTVGYGDITPRTDLAKFVVMCQLVATLSHIGFHIS